MNKKRIFVNSFLFAALLLVCGCLMFASNILAAVEGLVVKKPATESAVVEFPVNAGESSPVCMSQLATMLQDDANFTGTDNPLKADQTHSLVLYQVSGNGISLPKYETGVPAEFIPYQENLESQAKLWKFVTDVIPADQRKMVSEFIIFSDGSSNTTGAVGRAEIPNTWTLELDIIDSQNLSTLSTTLVHELGHMVTLNDGQVGDTDASLCENYMSADGCSKKDSYINVFFTAFWKNIYGEWASTVITKKGEIDGTHVLNYYNKYPEEFVTDYAASGPEEDIAESWMYFVLRPRPARDNIAERKILFFYNYPELVQLRQKVLNGLCQYVQK
jgi:hypothetical protein